MPTNAHLSALGPFDCVVVFGYIAALVGFGLLAARRKASPLDYFLASRATRWPAIGLATFASNISSTALVGLAGGAYAIGISVYDYEWSAIVVLVLFCTFLLPLVIASRTFTMPGFLEQRYDSRCRVLFALLTLFITIVVDSAGVLYSGSLVCRLLFPSAPLWVIVWLLAGSAALYTIAGGLKAVIFTEVVQAFVLIAGSTLISVLAFDRAGGWHAVLSQVDPAKLSLIRPRSDPGLPWPGLLTGIPLLGFYYWCTNQTVVQRMLSAKDINHARWGALFAGLLKLPVLFLAVLPGICAIIIFPHLSRADLVYPSLILNILPAGAMGLVVAGFVAATIVSTASMLNSASSLITLDLIRYFQPRLSDRYVVRAGRCTTAVLLLVAIAWAPQLTRFASLWQYLQAVLAYAVPPAVAVFLIGLFWRGATARGATVTLLAGSIAGAALFVCNAVLGLSHLHFLYVAPVLTALDTLVLIGVSLLWPTTANAESSATIWRPSLYKAQRAGLEAMPSWQDYRVLAAALLVLTAALVIAFR